MERYGAAFRPDFESFRDFSRFIHSIEPRALRDGIVKVRGP